MRNTMKILPIACILAVFGAFFFKFMIPAVISDSEFNAAEERWNLAAARGDIEGERKAWREECIAHMKHPMYDPSREKPCLGVE